MRKEAKPKVSEEIDVGRGKIVDPLALIKLQKVSPIFDYYGLSSPKDILALQNLSSANQADRFGDLLLIYELVNHAQGNIVKTKGKDKKGGLSTLDNDTLAITNLWMYERMTEIILTGKIDFNEFVEKLRSLLRQIEVEFSYNWQYFEGRIYDFYEGKGGWGLVVSDQLLIDEDETPKMIYYELKEVYRSNGLKIERGQKAAFLLHPGKQQKARRVWIRE